MLIWRENDLQVKPHVKQTPKVWNGEIQHVSLGSVVQTKEFIDRLEEEQSHT